MSVVPNLWSCLCGRWVENRCCFGIQARNGSTDADVIMQGYWRPAIEGRTIYSFVACGNDKVVGAWKMSTICLSVLV